MLGLTDDQLGTVMDMAHTVPVVTALALCGLIHTDAA